MTVATRDEEDHDSSERSPRNHGAHGDLLTSGEQLAGECEPSIFC
jgi:hypothetical protein